MIRKNEKRKKNTTLTNSVDFLTTQVGFEPNLK